MLPRGNAQTNQVPRSFKTLEELYYIQTGLQYPSAASQVTEHQWTIDVIDTPVWEPKHVEKQCGLRATIVVADFKRFVIKKVHDTLRMIRRTDCHRTR